MPELRCRASRSVKRLPQGLEQSQRQGQACAPRLGGSGKGGAWRHHRVKSFLFCGHVLSQWAFLAPIDACVVSAVLVLLGLLSVVGVVRCVALLFIAGDVFLAELFMKID